MNANEIIVVKQLPVIEEKLKTVKSEVENKINLALSLVCTEETVKEIKKTRSELNGDFARYEEIRKGIKNQIMEPYSNFEATYKDCVSDMYKTADSTLSKRIAEVENEVKDQKRNDIETYFNEYKESKNIDFVSFKDANITVTLSASKKSLKEAAKQYIDAVVDDLVLIDTQEDKAEILAEYKSCMSASKAITTVSERKAKIAREKERLEQVKRLKEQKMQSAKQVQAVAEKQCEESVEVPDSLTAPIVIEKPQINTENVQEKKYSASFKVTGTIEQLKSLKALLIKGGYEYEQL